MMGMRTNIDLDDALVGEAKKYSRARTKRALVEEALRTFVQVKSEAKRRESYAERVKVLQQRLSATQLRESPSRVLREDRAR
jgi:Arc/MetJ family transcription regulator